MENPPVNQPKRRLLRWAAVFVVCLAVSVVWLKKQPAIQAVHYAGLHDHPQAELVRKQQSAGGMVIAFEVVGGVQAAWSHRCHQCGHCPNPP